MRQDVCNCGLSGHDDQRWLFPVGLKVRTINTIYNFTNNPVPSGATGRVSSHCDDGRVWFDFEGYEGSYGHTFHMPSDYLRAAECRACSHVIDEDDEGADEISLCALCHEINYLAHEYGYDEIRRALPLLEELGSRESERLGESSVA